MNNQDVKDKRYKFVYQGFGGKTLYYTYHWCPNIKYARNLARMLKAESSLNIRKIEVVRSKL